VLRLVLELGDRVRDKFTVRVKLRVSIRDSTGSGASIMARTIA
jgi:hypothetical protein